MVQVVQILFHIRQGSNVSSIAIIMVADHLAMK